MSDTASSQPPPGVALVGNQPHRIDAKGRLIPEHLVATEAKLEDEIVRELIASADAENGRLRAFRQKAFETVDTFLALLAADHNVKIGGAKGNITLQTIDGLMKVQVAVQDRLTFGPKLQVAKAIIDELALEWGKTAPELYAMASQAFDVDKEGKVNATALLGLTRLSIDNDRWREAMRALRESMTSAGSARYVRFYRRAATDDRYESVTLDLANA